MAKANEQRRKEITVTVKPPVCSLETITAGVATVTSIVHEVTADAKNDFTIDWFSTRFSASYCPLQYDLLVDDGTGSFISTSSSSLSAVATVSGNTGSIAALTDNTFGERTF